MVRPTPADVAAAKAPVRDFRITSKDGLSLAATYWPGFRPNSPGVLLLHGNGASRGAMAPNAAWLASKGFAALTIDFRGHGQSDQAPHSFGLNEALDAQAAFEWLKQAQADAPLAVVGISLGGAASLLGADGPLPADALILQAVYPDIRHAIRNRIASRTNAAAAIVLEPLLSFQSWLRLGVRPSRLSPLTAIRRYRGPVLIIGGGADHSTPPLETRQMFEAAPTPKSLWLVPGKDHEGVADLQTVAYRERLHDFLLQTVGSRD